MKRYRAILVLTAVLVILLPTLFFVFLVPKEPVYEGRPISQWLEQMSGPVGGSAGAVSSQALPKLVQREPGEEAVPALRSVLRRGRTLGSRLYARFYPKLPPVLMRKLPVPNPGRDAELRYRGALILYYIGPKAKTALADLIYALSDQSAEVRRVAATAIGAVDANSPRAASALSTALSDPAPGVRKAVVKALGQTTRDRSSASFEIAAALKDTDPSVRVEAALMLKNFGPGAKGVVPALIQALRDTDQDVVLFAAQALGKIGPAAHDAAPALQESLRNAGPNTETTLRWALNQVTIKSVSQSRHP